MDESIFKIKFRSKRLKNRLNTFKTIEDTTIKYSLGKIGFGSGTRKINFIKSNKLKTTYWISLIHNDWDIKEYNDKNTNNFNLNLGYYLLTKENNMLFYPVGHEGWSSHGCHLKLDNYYIARHNITYKINSVPTYFAVGISIKNLITPVVSIGIGNYDLNVCDDIENDNLLLELAKSFIVNNELQIIDYIQEKDYEISKIFN